MSKYNVGAHTTHRLKYHLVWIPKYRKRVLRGPLARRLYELLAQCAEMNNWAIIELNVRTVKWSAAKPLHSTDPVVPFDPVITILLMPLPF